MSTLDDPPTRERSIPVPQGRPNLQHGGPTGTVSSSGTGTSELIHRTMVNDRAIENTKDSYHDGFNDYYEDLNVNGRTPTSIHWDSDNESPEPSIGFKPELIGVKPELIGSKPELIGAKPELNWPLITLIEHLTRVSIKVAV